MLTLDALKAYGAKTDEGLARCRNMEPFYLKIVGMVLADANFEALKQAMAAYDENFVGKVSQDVYERMEHALKRIGERIDPPKEEDKEK